MLKINITSLSHSRFKLTDSGNETKTGQGNVDSEITVTTSFKEDTERRQDDG